MFQEVSRMMVREMSLQEVLQGIVRLVAGYMDCDSCLVYLLDNDELVLCASNTPHPATIGKVRLKLTEGLTGWVAREKRLLAISTEAYKDPRFKYFGDLPEDSFEAFLSAPVIARNRVVGVINVQHRLTHPHTGDEMEVLSTVGEQVGCLLVPVGSCEQHGPNLGLGSDAALPAAAGCDLRLDGDGVGELTSRDRFRGPDQYACGNVDAGLAQEAFSFMFREQHIIYNALYLPGGQFRYRIGRTSQLGAGRDRSRRKPSPP